MFIISITHSICKLLVYIKQAYSIFIQISHYYIKTVYITTLFSISHEVLNFEIAHTRQTLSLVPRPNGAERVANANRLNVRKLVSAARASTKYWKIIACSLTRRCLHRTREVVTGDKCQPPHRKGQVSSSSKHNQGPRGGRSDVLCCSKSWSFTSSAASSAVASSPRRPPMVPRPPQDTICSLEDRRWWAWQIVILSQS